MYYYNIMNGLYIPKDILHIILEYDGRIKYKNGKYFNVIRQNDERYNIITPIISKKMVILNNIDLRGSEFYFEFGFDIDSRIGLCYDYGFNETNVFEICYYDTRNGWEQIRTYL
uniref:Uncharacterized protein n=1 Tax=viral metagenome TaxID=1070528 RepID=A0A6C0K2G6_9ZZZZ